MKVLKFGALSPSATCVLFYFAQFNLLLGLLALLNMLMLAFMSGSYFAPEPSTARLISMLPYIAGACSLVGFGAAASLRASEGHGS